MITEALITAGRRCLSSRWNGSSDAFSSIPSNPLDEEDLVFLDGPIHKQAMDTCYKWLNRVVRLCQQPRLNLKVSPPYLLDIIPDIYEKLRIIIASYDYDYERLSQIDYFRIFITSLLNRSRRAVWLFNQASESIFSPQSRERFSLVKLSLVFSHLQKDLEALFPGVKLVENFRITKPDAAKWWSQHFGRSLIISWEKFKLALEQTFQFPMDDKFEALHETVDLTCNGHVSIFEFDVFTRLFQPWSNILETWRVLVLLHPAYKAFMTYDGVKALLNQYRSDPGPGTYVFRLSCTQLGQWAIGYITTERTILQTLIQNRSLAQALLDGERKRFYRYPNGMPTSPTFLMQFVNQLHPIRVKVTQEQFQVYLNMRSTFEICKICDEHDKNVQLEPCGHLICKHCLINCQCAGNNQTCPFCRLEIKGTESVIVEPFNPTQSTEDVYSLSSKQMSLWDQLELTSQGEAQRNVLPTITFPNHPVATQHASTCSLNSSSSPSSTTAPIIRCPPPVPPRTNLVKSQRDEPDATNAIISHGSPPSDGLNHVFCYPEMMFANGSCLASTTTPSFEATGSTSLCPRSIDAADVDDNGRGASSGVIDSIPPRSETSSLAINVLPSPTCSSIVYPSNPGGYSSGGVVDEMHGITNDDGGAALNYAQLDLFPLSDSEVSVDEDHLWRPPFTMEHNPHLTNSTNSASIANEQYEPAIALTIAESMSALGVSQADNSQLSSRETEETNEHVIRYLLSLHPNMDWANARLLLSITHNQVHMADQIWRHFMPRARKP